MNVAPGASYEAVIETGITGLAGTLTVLVQDNIGGTATASATTAITERPAGSGIYVAIRTAPTIAGTYTIVWSTDGSYDPATVTTELLYVTASAAEFVAVGDTYATTSELAQILQVNHDANEDALARVLAVAAAEINAETGIDPDEIEGWQIALAAEVNLERAVEHWQQLKSPFGVIGIGSEFGSTTRVARDSWERHAHKLAPLKESWGIA